MSKNNQKNALKKINDVVDIIPAPEVMDFFTKLTNAYKEAKTTEREIAVIEAQKEVLLKNIEKNMIYIIRCLIGYLMKEKMQ